MVVLGLLLLLGAGALTAAVVMANTDTVAVIAFGESASGLTIGGLFLAGVITGAIAILGLTMMLAGLSRRRARRVGLKREMRDVRDERETLAEENARLRDELAASRSGSASYADDDAVYPDDTVGRHADTDRTERHGLFNR
jgi:membrane protein implicated in regulation of membrane protease activity